MNHRILRVGLLLGMALFVLGGCSNFDREWREAGQKKLAGIDGRWQGSWKSQQDGHTGALLCVIHQTSPTSYNASFNATYSGIFHFSYDAKLTSRSEGNLVYLTGEQDLGWPVGMYHYEGTANPTQFYCAYRSKDDHGYFALARPGGTPPEHPLLPQTK
jgi:hypothetical protein